MSRRGKSSGKGLLLKLIIAALAALAASAVFKKKVLAPAPATDYRLPSTPPPNPSAAMGPEESTPLTEQEKASLATAAGIRSGETSVEITGITDEETGIEIDDVLVDTIDEDVESGQTVENIVEDTIIADPETGIIAEEIVTETITTDTETGEVLSDDISTETILTDADTGEVLLDEIDLDDESDAIDSSGEMGIAAEAPSDALSSGKGFVYPSEVTHECPEDYPIKGNASSRIYHRPGESSYDATIPEICFASDAAADAAGYRERKR
jgi:hypothetical protein